MVKQYSEMPMPAFCEVVARSLFQNKYPEEEQIRKNDQFTAYQKLDTNEIEDTMLAVFYQRIYFMLRNVHLKKPDEMIFALYGRRAGGTVSGKFTPEMKMCSAILLRDIIQLQDDGNDIILRDGNISKPCKIERTEMIPPDPEKLKAHPNKYSKPVITGRMNPIVPKDKSTIVLKERGEHVKSKGKVFFRPGTVHSVVKMRDHLSHVVWVAWSDDDPVASQTHIDEQKRVEELQNELGLQNTTSENNKDDEEVHGPIVVDAAEFVKKKTTKTVEKD